MTTYAIVKWNPGFDRARFDQAKGQGVQQTAMETVRKSLDGKFAVLKWSGTEVQLPPAIGANLVETYDHTGILTEMSKPEWSAHFLPPAVLSLEETEPVLFQFPGTEPIEAEEQLVVAEAEAPATPSFFKRHKWKIITGATAAAAAAAEALHYFGVV